MKNSWDLRSEYQARINRVMDYIEANLGETHTLEELASVANFSRFHFHRIFTSITKETPWQFLTRLRVEKAAALLRNNRKMTVSEISCQCGFSSLALFSRTFRQSFRQSPSAWRNSPCINGIDPTANFRNPDQTDSNQDQTVSNQREGGEEFSWYFCRETNTFKWRTAMKLNKSMEVKQLPKMTVAYLRHTGPYQGNEQLFQRLTEELCRWAGPRGLLNDPGTKILVVYHDDPKVTEPDKLRLSMCIPVPGSTKVDGKIGLMEIAGGTYAVGRFEVGGQEFGEAWDWLYGTWLPESGYQPDDGPCFESYPEEPQPGEKIKVDICVPVIPL